MPSLVRRTRVPATDLLTLDALAHDAGLHPDLARRLVALGVVTPTAGTWSAPLFARSTVPRLALAMRLHRDLGVSYAGAALACDLLARIDALEQRLRRYEPDVQTLEVITWTSVD